MKSFNIITVATAAAGILISLTALPSEAKSCFAYLHPRRAEVLHRDNNLNSQLWADRGHLGGNFGRLEAQDQRIRFQEQRDARLNGGHITAGEQAHLNREENRLQSRINADFR